MENIETHQKINPLSCLAGFYWCVRICLISCGRKNRNSRRLSFGEWWYSFCWYTDCNVTSLLLLARASEIQNYHSFCDKPCGYFQAFWSVLEESQRKLKVSKNIRMVIGVLLSLSQALTGSVTCSDCQNGSRIRIRLFRDLLLYVFAVFENFTRINKTSLLVVGIGRSRRQQNRNFEHSEFFSIWNWSLKCTKMHTNSVLYFIWTLQTSSRRHPTFLEPKNDPDLQENVDFVNVWTAGSIVWKRLKLSRVCVCVRAVIAVSVSALPNRFWVNLDVVSELHYGGTDTHATPRNHRHPRHHFLLPRHHRHHLATIQTSDTYSSL